MPRSVPSNGVVWIPAPCSRPDTGLINIYLGTIESRSQVFGPVTRGQLLPIYGQGRSPGPVIVGIECLDTGRLPNEYYLIDPFRITAPAARPAGIGRPAPRWQPLDRGRSRADVLAGWDRAHGSMHGQVVNAEIVAMADARRPGSSGSGYWLAAGDGGVFTFGGTPFLGSMGGQPLNAPIVDIAAARSGAGYWLLGRDGGVFAFGAAPFLGSAASLGLRSPAVALLPTTSGRGYWIVLADGGVVTFGDAPFHGSAATAQPGAPIAAACSDPRDGYVLVATDGTVFTFGGQGSWPFVTPDLVKSQGGVARGDAVVALDCPTYYGGPGIVATAFTASGASLTHGGNPGAALVGGGRLLDVAGGWRLVQR